MKFIVKPIKFSDRGNNCFDNVSAYCEQDHYGPVICGTTKMCWSYCNTECYYHWCVTYTKDSPENVNKNNYK